MVLENARQTAEEVAGAAAIVILSPLIIAYIGHHKLNTIYKTYTSDEPQHQATRRQRKHRRRKSLSRPNVTFSKGPEKSRLAFSTSLISRKRELNPQLQSELMSLPTEIRLEIYRHVCLNDPFVHVHGFTKVVKCDMRDPSGIPDFNATGSPQSELCGFSEEQWTMARKHVRCFDADRFGDGLPRASQRGIIELLQSCRRM